MKVLNVKEVSFTSMTPIRNVATHDIFPTLFAIKITVQNKLEIGVYGEGSTKEHKTLLHGQTY
jgi:hypothetical protein